MLSHTVIFLTFIDFVRRLVEGGVCVCGGGGGAGRAITSNVTLTFSMEEKIFVRRGIHPHCSLLNNTL